MTEFICRCRLLLQYALYFRPYLYLRAFYGWCVLCCWNIGSMKARPIIEYMLANTMYSPNSYCEPIVVPITGKRRYMRRYIGVSCWWNRWIWFYPAWHVCFAFIWMMSMHCWNRRFCLHGWNGISWLIEMTFGSCHLLAWAVFKFVWCFTNTLVARCFWGCGVWMNLIVGSGW